MMSPSAAAAAAVSCGRQAAPPPPQRQQRQKRQQQPPPTQPQQLPPPPPPLPADAGANPLELLRLARDPPHRAALMRRAAQDWAGWSGPSCYRPLAVERLLSRELGVAPREAMLLAVGNPDLASAFPALAGGLAGGEDGGDGEDEDGGDGDGGYGGPCLAPARRALRALRGAALSDQEAWYALSRRPLLLTDPPALRRWLDLLALYEARPADVVSFFTRAPDALLREPERAAAAAAADAGRVRGQAPPTLAEAHAVARYLVAELRIDRGQLAARVLCARPGVLLRDVERDLRPLQAFCERVLGLAGAGADWGRVVVAAPELLEAASVERHLRPFLTFCEGLGASPAQAGRLLASAPRLPLGPPPAAGAGLAPAAADAVVGLTDGSGVGDACPAEAALAPALRALGRLAGVRMGTEAMRRLAAAPGGLDWLAGGGAPPGAQLRALARGLGPGCRREDLGKLAVACPAVLSQRPDDLLRRAGWLRLAASAEEGSAGGGAGDEKVAAAAAALRLALAHPHVLAAPLRHLTAPRFAFARAAERADAGALAPAAARAAGRAAAQAALEGEARAAEGREQDEEEEDRDDTGDPAAGHPAPVLLVSSSSHSCSPPLPDLTALVAPALDDDAAWLADLAASAAAIRAPPSSSAPACGAASASAFRAYRAEFDRGYAARIAEAATAELRALGILAVADR